MARQHVDQMPFLDHLEELRFRLFWMVGALFVAAAISFYLVQRFDILLVLQRPILPFLAGDRLAVLGPGEAFRITISVSLILAVIMALPVIGYHIWAFLSPGLYAHEKKLMVPVVLGATILFAAGVALSFFVVLPLTLDFLIGLASKSFETQITAEKYFGFLITMSLAFGAVFELPIVIVALTALGLVTPVMLVTFRRYAFVACLVLSAFVTPGGDPLSMAALAVPLYGLYEVSVVLSRFVYRRRQRKRAAEAAEDGSIGVPA